jgi:hypothetical protein
MNLSVVVGGVEYDISQGETAWLQDWDNLGMADLHRLSERGSQQDGETDQGYRLDPRYPTLVLGSANLSKGAYWDSRAKLLRVFRPGASVIILKCTLDNGDVRQLDCWYFGGMNMANKDREGRHQKVGVVLKAPDPTFYDPTGEALTFSLGGGTDEFVVPYEVPYKMGASTIDASIAVDYVGSATSYPHLIRISGPITNPIISNGASGDTLDFTGTTIADGDYYDIDCRYGYKTVTSKAGTNRLDKLTAGSDLATFALLPAEDGSATRANVIRVRGSAVTAETKVEISYYDRFIGI